MSKFFICLLSVLLSAGYANAGEIEIRYHAEGANEVYLVWGINDWTKPPVRPAGTVSLKNSLRTPLQLQKGEFVLKIDLPAGNIIDYYFDFTKKEGPFHLPVSYNGYNSNEPGKKFFHTGTDSSQVVTIMQDEAFISLQNDLSSPKYAGAMLALLTFLAVLLFYYRKYFLKRPAVSANPKAMFVAVVFTFLFFLFLIRGYVTHLLMQFFIRPFVFPVMVKTFEYDFLYAALLTGIFAVLFFTRKKSQKYILYTYIFFVVLSLVIALLNSKLIQVLGKPFNFQWLYYSDFLNSTDSSKTLGANMEAGFIGRSLFILLACIPFCWLVYRLYLKKPLAIPGVLALCLLLGFLPATQPEVQRFQTVNPVFYFINSLGGTESFSIFSGNSPAKKSEFNIKNNDTAATKYATLFHRQQIKNAIVVVLESTPAEYISAYNSTINATPFLDSIKSQAVKFNTIYAHVPATNKSMVSFLCGSYPHLSYRSITKEYPAIDLPSLSSVLKQAGYRTAFFNAGDNQYQNAAGFLQHRSFDVIRDYRENNCATTVFSDKRYKGEGLDGVKDSCLSVNFFNWFKEDTSKPFFTMMWTFQTHYPYFPSGNRVNYGTGNYSLEKYLNSLRQADETIRQITETLKRKNLLESTLIVVMGDHGEAFGRHGQTTHAAGIFEENLHIPLLFINPLFSGEQISVPGGISDIAPSILSVLNRKAPAEWQGENLFSENRRKRVYFFSPYSDYLFGFRQDDYKFIFNATDNTFALYNLATDPYETVNIADQQPAFVKEAKSNLQAWMQYQSAYMDSVLKEKVKP